MRTSVKTRIVCARVITAAQTGNHILPLKDAEAALPDDCLLLYAAGFKAPPFDRDFHLEPPFENVPVMPDSAVYPGQIIGVVTGPDWKSVDTAAQRVRQDRDTTVSTESRLAWTDKDEAHVDDSDGSDSPRGEDDSDGSDSPRGEVDSAESNALRKPDDWKTNGSDHADSRAGTNLQIIEGEYATEMQLHRLDAPLWVEAQTESGYITLRVPTQWPSHVRHTVAKTLRIDPRRVDVRVIPVEGGRDGALFFPSLLASIVALCSTHLKAVVRLGLRNDQMMLTGGRSPANIRYVTTLAPDGKMLRNSVTVRLDCGAYPTLVPETGHRLRAAVGALYDMGDVLYSARALRTITHPMGAFEGIGTAQVTFAREVHLNRLAGIANDDPISWRNSLFRQDWPILSTLARTLAEEAGFHRRYAANELVRKRRLQLPRNTTALKGIGCAFGEQISGIASERERGNITIRLEQDGSARLHCSVPTPTPRLRAAWKNIVAQELQISPEEVTLDTSCRSDQYDSGPRLFSRGASVIPRAILSACEAIQKQRFREPLPIQVRRMVKASRATRNPADALRSIGATAVEATIIPATMEIDVRSVTIVVYAGKILDRQASETELRRGIYQALSWTLHETLDRTTQETSRERDLLGDPVVQRQYTPGFTGAPPKIKVVFLPPGKRETPVGIGEIPFLTVPAALMSALSQASGLYLDTIPARPRDILQMLREEE